MSGALREDLAEVVAVLGRLRVPVGGGHMGTDEAPLQRRCGALLTAAGIPWAAEVRLSARDRIDLLGGRTGRVGIECKVRGSPAAILAQLLRYAEAPEVGALVLVSTRSVRLPDTVGGKLLMTVTCWQGFL